jgi:polyhydroxyalkanoate synthesis repressor PhaR
MAATAFSSPGPETILRKYPNRRIYDPSKNTHVTLADLADRIKTGERIRIVDNQTGEDITSSVMAQVLYETLKSRPDYLPLDLLTLMIRAQDNVVRDFLFNGLPYAFQYYIDAQRRLMSGMGWMNPNFPGAMNPFLQGFSPFFGGGPGQPSSPMNPSPQGSPTAGSSAPPSYQTPPPAPPPAGDADARLMREEMQRLREELNELRERERAAPPEGKRRKSKDDPR